MRISEFRQRYIEAMKMSERSKITELFRLADDLESAEKTEENYRILSDVFSYLGYYTKAYHYLSEVANTQDMKDAKNLYRLKDRLECEGDRYASKRPRKTKDGSIKIPSFKYCSQPLQAGLFEKVDSPEVCDCCGKGTSVIYSGPFYCVEDINILCPKCIASGKASKKFDGEFVDSAILSSPIQTTIKRNYVAEHRHTMDGNKNIGQTIVGISANL